MFLDDVQDGDTFYLALHVSKDDDIAPLHKALSAIVPCVAHLNQFRLMLMIFADRIEDIRLFNESNISDMITISLDSSKWSIGTNIDAVLGMVMNDYTTVRTSSKRRAKLFIHANGDLSTFWSLSTLAQTVDMIWLKHQGLDFGTVREIDYPAVMILALQRALQPFAVEVPAIVKDTGTVGVVGRSWVEYRHFREALRTMRIVDRLQ